MSEAIETEMQKILIEVGGSDTMEYRLGTIVTAMSRAYDRGRFDQRVEDDLRSPAGRSQAG